MDFSEKNTFIVCEILETCQFVKNFPDEYYSTTHLSLSRSWCSKHVKNGTLGPLLTNCKKSIAFFWTKTWLLLLRDVSKRYFLICCSLQFNHSTYCCSWQNSNQAASKVSFTPSAGMIPFQRGRMSSSSQRLNSTVNPVKSMGLCLTPLMCLPQDPAPCNCIQISDTCTSNTNCLVLNTSEKAWPLSQLKEYLSI